MTVLLARGRRREGVTSSLTVPWKRREIGAQSMSNGGRGDGAGPVASRIACRAGVSASWTPRDAADTRASRGREGFARAFVVSCPAAARARFMHKQRGHREAVIDLKGASPL